MLIRHCDLCGKTAERQALHLHVGRSMDGAGSYNTDSELFDLCGECAFGELQRLVTLRTYEEQAAYYAGLNRRRKK